MIDKIDLPFWRHTASREFGSTSTIRVLPYYGNVCQHLATWKERIINGKSSSYNERCIDNVRGDDPAKEYAIKRNQKLAKGNGTKPTIKQINMLNVLVINDDVHPENNGKIFVWNCPHDILKELLETNFAYADPETGRNIKIETYKMVGKDVHYKKSVYDKPSKLMGDEDLNVHDLDSLLDERYYKTREVLMQRLIQVLGYFHVQGVMQDFHDQDGAIKHIMEGNRLIGG